MKQEMSNNGGGTNKIMSRLAAEKKKTVMALCLIAVMVFMWSRVIGKKTPQAAIAVTAQNMNTNVSGANSELKISFIELPKVAGRNDVLSRDFFDAGGWGNFRGQEGENFGGVKEVSVDFRGGSSEVAKKAAEKLKLEAIIGGNNPRAFINDKLMSTGDKLTISDGAKTYEYQIVGIEVNKVIVRCGEAEITLNLSQTIEVSN